MIWISRIELYGETREGSPDHNYDLSLVHYHYHGFPHPYIPAGLEQEALQTLFLSTFVTQVGVGHVRTCCH